MSVTLSAVAMFTRLGGVGCVGFVAQIRRL